MRIALVECPQRGDKLLVGVPTARLLQGLALVSSVFLQVMKRRRRRFVCDRRATTLGSRALRPGTLLACSQTKALAGDRLGSAKIFNSTSCSYCALTFILGGFSWAPRFAKVNSERNFRLKI